MKRILLSLVVFALSAAAFAAEATWLTDFKKAQETAKKESKPIFMVFSGSTWCPPCKALIKQLFSTKEFIEYANKNLVLIEVDFPDNEAMEEWMKYKRLPKSANMSGAQLIHNEALAQKYKIEGFPTIVLLDKNSKELGRSGYGEFREAGSPAKYLKELDKLFGKK